MIFENNNNPSDKCFSNENSKVYLDTVQLSFNIDLIGTYWYGIVQFPNKSVKFKLDTGAQCNVIGFELAEELNDPIVKTKVKKLISFSNHEMNVKGEINVLGKNKNNNVN